MCRTASSVASGVDRPTTQRATAAKNVSFHSDGGWSVSSPSSSVRSIRNGRPRHVGFHDLAEPRARVIVGKSAHLAQPESRSLMIYMLCWRRRLRFWWFWCRQSGFQVSVVAFSAEPALPEMSATLAPGLRRQAMPSQRRRQPVPVHDCAICERRPHPATHPKLGSPRHSRRMRIGAQRSVSVYRRPLGLRRTSRSRARQPWFPVAATSRSDRTSSGVDRCRKAWINPA
jgi:hypothetical protein